MSLFHGIKWIDTLGAVNAFKNVDGNPRVVNQTYLEQIAEGNVSGHTAWSKIGFNPDVGTSEEDIWSAGGAYAFPAAAAQWEVDSLDNDDIGVVLYGNAEGANQTTLCDVCTATTFVDGSENFANVEVGDCILISPKGTTPQWGYVTDITNKATGTLGVSGGWSGSAAGSAVPSGEAYTIVDKNGDTGAQVVKIDYLNGSYEAKSCLVCLNGTTDVLIDGSDGAAATDKFRVNSFRVIAAGSSGVAEGAISLRLDDSTVYAYITATKTRARNQIYTVPLGKTLYVNMWTVGWGYTSATSKNEYIRVYTRANVEPGTKLNTGAIFYPYTEVNLSNGTTTVPFTIPTALPAKTDIRVTAVASAAGGACSSVLRGWLE